ncbi:hypothetical protein JCM9279_002336 [Rhodotorula babjevae]
MSLEDYDDLDFDDPRFLQLAASAAPPAELSYAQKRKRALIRGEDKGRNKSRKQQEEDKRAEGLGTNLIQRAEQDGGDSKALQMMKSMGYKPGDALGRQADAEPAPSTSSAPSTSAAAAASAAGPSRGGLGFARASFAPVGGAASSSAESAPAPASAPQARTEPIRFEMRAARTGLGVPPASRLKPYLSVPTSSGGSSSAANADPSTLPDLAGYLSHLKSSVDERRAHGILRALRRTCEELDRRAGETESYMWRDPDEEEREADKKRRRKVFDRIDQELESDEEKGTVFGETKSGKEGRGELAYERGTSGTVVDIEEDDDDDDGKEANERAEDEETAAQPRRTAAQVKQDEEDEAAEWFEMDVRSRLALMLTYLRNKYHYCFWCGTQYDDEKDLEENCPGTEEDDH